VKEHDEGLARAGVSREAADMLTHYIGMLKKWNPVINLVSRSSLHDVWRRHVLDSLQVWNLAKIHEGKIVDLGSGGGFPGVPIAIIAKAKGADVSTTLVESDQRKATFLAEVVRELALDTQVLNCRIEDVEPLGANCVTARALAPLHVLLGFADRHLSGDGAALFLKGGAAPLELEAARQRWRFDVLFHQSETDQSGRILEVSGISRAA